MLLVICYLLFFFFFFFFYLPGNNNNKMVWRVRGTKLTSYGILLLSVRVTPYEIYWKLDIMMAFVEVDKVLY